MLLMTTAGQCEIVDCVRHSDCGLNGQMCDSGECVNPGDTDGGSTTEIGDSGGDSCVGYGFEAPEYTITDLECNPVETPVDFDIPVPFDDITLVPMYTAGAYAEADYLYNAGICSSTGSTPTGAWEVPRQGFTEHVYNACHSEVSVFPGCEGDIADDVCSAVALEYYMTLGSVPPLTEATGILMTDGPCEGGSTLMCGGSDSGVDGSSGG